jgi:hypothetical protein
MNAQAHSVARSESAVVGTDARGCAPAERRRVAGRADEEAQTMTESRPPGTPPVRDGAERPESSSARKGSGRSPTEMLNTDEHPSSHERFMAHRHLGMV